jgi:hypothetical protein
MKRVVLAAVAVLWLSSFALADKEADRQKALAVYKEYYRLYLEATRAKAPIQTPVFRDQAAQKFGYKNWLEFSEKMGLVLVKEDWTWVTDEASKWYKAEQAKPATPAPAETPSKEVAREQALKVYKAYYAGLIDVSRKGQAADQAALMNDAARQGGFAGWDDFVARSMKILGAEGWKAVTAEGQEWYTQELNRLAAEDAKKTPREEPGFGEGRRAPPLPPVFRVGAKLGRWGEEKFSVLVREVWREWIRGDMTMRLKKVVNPEAVLIGEEMKEEEVEITKLDVWVHVTSRPWIWTVLEPGPGDAAAQAEPPRPMVPPAIAEGAWLERLEDRASWLAGGERYCVKAVWGNWVRVAVGKRHRKADREAWICFAAPGIDWRVVGDKESRSEGIGETVAEALKTFYQANLEAVRKRKAFNYAEVQEKIAKDLEFQDWAEMMKLAKEALGAQEVKRLEDEAAKWYEEEMKKGGRGPRERRGGPGEAQKRIEDLFTACNGLRPGSSTRDTDLLLFFDSENYEAQAPGPPMWIEQWRWENRAPDFERKVTSSKVLEAAGGEVRLEIATLEGLKGNAAKGVPAQMASFSYEVRLVYDNTSGAWRIRSMKRKGT